MIKYVNISPNITLNLISYQFTSFSEQFVMIYCPTWSISLQSLAPGDIKDQLRMHFHKHNGQSIFLIFKSLSSLSVPHNEKNSSAYVKNDGFITALKRNKETPWLIQVWTNVTGVT